MRGLIRRALPVLAALTVLAVIIVGNAGAGSAQAAPLKASQASAAADCSPPSLADLVNSDTFWYWPCAAFLHVALNPAGESKGFVRSAPDYIDCPWACTRPFGLGSAATLWAFPSEGVTFDGWTGAGCVGQGNPCVTTVNGDMTVTANFSGEIVAPPTPGSQTHTLGVFMGNDSNGTVTGTDGFICNNFIGPTCTTSYATGTSVTLTETGGGNCAYFKNEAATEPNPYTFTITADTFVRSFSSTC